MEKILFDSHSHISDEAYKDCKEELISEIRNSDLKYCMDIGCSVETSLDSIKSAESYDFCFATVGVHPENVDELTEDNFEPCMSAFIDNPKVVAIGEIGLDFHYEDNPDRDTQVYWFKRQIKWAVEHKAPICIHSRDADELTMEVLKDAGAFSKERIADFPPKPDGKPDARVLLHCFSGSAELARQYVKLGASISLGGPLTYKNSRKAVEVAETIDLTDLLIETDSPYLAPVPLRGTVNKPTNVEYVARKLAEIKGITYEEAAKATLANACRFYEIKELK